MKGLKYYLCKYIGHEDWSRGRIVTIEDVCSSIMTAIMIILGVLFVILLCAAIIIFFTTASSDEVLRLIRNLIIGVVGGSIIICALEYYNEISDYILIKCKK